MDIDNVLNEIQAELLQKRLLVEGDKYADAELNLRYAGLFDQDSDYGGMLGQSVLDLFKAFCDQGHSGMSAALTCQLFQKLVKGEALTAKYWDEKAKQLREMWNSNGPKEGYPEIDRAGRTREEAELEFVEMCIGKRPEESKDMVD